MLETSNSTAVVAEGVLLSETCAAYDLLAKSFFLLGNRLDTVGPDRYETGDDLSCHQTAM
jgi:hypothetical protein